MRNLKKILSVLLVVAMLVASMVPAFAADTFTYEKQAKALYDIGLFKGTSATEFVPELGGSLTREQGITLLVRLLGKDADAAKLTDAEATAALANFTDAKSIEASFVKSVAYAVKNKMVLGATETTIDSKGALTGNAYATMILRNLGFTVDAKGFDTAAATLNEKGGLSKDEVTKFATKSLIRDDLVGISYAALQAKDSTGKTVIENLVATKAVDETKAAAAGVYTKAAAAGALTAKVTGAKSVTLTFDSAVDSAKAVITVKKGTSALVVDKTTYAADKKSVVITYTTKLTAGDYAVTVSGIADKDLTAKFTAEEEKVSKIEFASDKALLAAASNFKVYAYFKILNQYNEDVTDAYYGESEFHYTTGGYAPTALKGGKIEIFKAGTTPFSYGDSVPVSIVYIKDNNTVTATTVMTVSNKAGIGEVSISSLYNDANKTLDRDSTFGSFYLVFDLKDQYGNVLSWDNTEDQKTIKTDLLVNSSNPSVVGIDKTTESIDGQTYNDVALFQELTINGVDKVVVPLSKAGTSLSGTAVVNAVSKATGKMAQYTVTVKDAQYVASFSMQTPDSVVIGEKTVIPFTAFDQNGAEITDVNVFKGATYGTSLAGFSVTGVATTAVYFEENPTTSKPQLVLNTIGNTTLKKDDTITITSTTDKTYKTSTLTLKMKDTKKIDSISSISSAFYNKIAVGSAVKFGYSNITFKDQYSRDITSSELRYQLISDATLKLDGATNTANNGQYRIVVTTSDNSKVRIAGSFGNAAKYAANGTDATDGYFFGQDNENLYLLATGEGVATIKVQLQKDANFGVSSTPSWANVADCYKTFTMTAVPQKDIKDFALNTLSKTYDAPKAVNNVITDDALLTNGTSYDQAIQVDGLTSDKSKVYISKDYITYASGVFTDAGDNYVIYPGYDKNVSVLVDTYADNTTKVAGVDAKQFVVKNKLRVVDTVGKTTTTGQVYGLVQDSDVEKTVPFTVAIDASFDNAKNLGSSYVVAKETPVISSLVLTHKNFAQLSNDLGSVIVSAADLSALSTYYTAAASSTTYVDPADGLTKNKTALVRAGKTVADAIVERIVADSVVAKDQYGKESGDEYLTTKDGFAKNFYTITYTGTVATGNTIEVTAIARNGAKTINFKIQFTN